MIENTWDFIAVDTTMTTKSAHGDKGVFFYDQNSKQQLFDVENAVCNYDEDHELPIGE